MILESLGLWSLEERRNRADLLEVFRMYKGWSTTSFDSMFTFSSNTRTRGNRAKIKNRCRLDLRRHFFSERVVDRWHCLEQHTIESGNYQYQRLHDWSQQDKICIERCLLILLVRPTVLRLHADLPLRTIKCCCVPFSLAYSSM